MKRMARIEGHVTSVRSMLEEGRSYPEVVHQLSAIRAALDSVLQVIVDDLVEDCVATTESRESATKSLVELRQVIDTMR